MALSHVAAQSFVTRASLAAACLLAAAAASAQQLPPPEVVYRVEYKTLEGSPNSLIQAADGHFYGTTSDSYAGGPGALFRLRADGLYTVLHRFTGGTDGGHPSGRLLQATNGRIYGMTGRGGRFGLGTIFWMAPDGRLTTLHDFSGPDGASPAGELIQAEDGALYGVTSGGGASEVGTAFRMSVDGSLQTLRHFEKRGQFDPASPVLGLVEYAGAFYGIVSAGWSASVYRMSHDGAAVTFVYDISLSDGDYSMIGLNGLPIKGSDGNLYGTTQNSCKGARGAFYRITPDATVLELRAFPSCSVAPFGRLIEARDGNFLVSSRGSVLRLTLKGEMTELGETPGVILLQSASGDLYGASAGISRVSLGVPQRVKVRGRGPIELTWSPVPGASSYLVKRTSASGEEVVLGRVTTTSFSDRAAVPGQRYVYSVSSTTSYGDSAFSSPATALANRVHDVDGDGRADLTVYSPRTGYWWFKNSSGAASSLVPWGGEAGDVAAPGDYDGEGTLDLTIFRPSTGTWYIRNVETAVWGQRGDTPIPGDYNGDGLSDIAVYRRTTGTWHIRGRAPIVWGGPNDIPVPADFDGDGVTDIAVYRPDTGVWFVRGGTSLTHGIVGDIPIPADYDGDGAADFAVFRRTTGTWHIKDQPAVSWGAAGDVPVALDRDGDGRVELGVYRRRRGDWYFKNLATGQEELATLQSTVEDVPIGRGIAQQQRVAARADSDFDGDGRDDVIVFRPSSTTWFMRHSDRAAVEQVVWTPAIFDNSPGRPLALDFNGDGLLDITEVKSDWQWWIKNGCCAHTVQLGAPGDIPVPGDYNADGTTDAAVFRPATGAWYIVGRGIIAFGGPSDIPVPADYDGDGMTDLAVYRAGTWFIRGGPSIQFGEPGSGDIPVPADYDADGIVDIAVYRPTTGTWYVRNQFTTKWGSTNDVPMPLDRDGDGRAELNVYRPSTGTWHFYNPVTGAIDSLALGAPGDIPVGRVRLWAYAGAQSVGAVAASRVAPSDGGAPASAGASIVPDMSSVGSSAGVTEPGASRSLSETRPVDVAVVEATHQGRAAARASGFRGHDVDGDGKADVMVYRPRTGEWWIRKSSGASTRLSLGGLAGDVPASGDYNGDGVMDPGIFRPDSGNWHISGVGIFTWGRTGDVPVPADYDGDGVTNVAVYRPSTGVWYIKGGANVSWGQPGDLPVPADYDGDGVTEIAVFRPMTGVWYVRGLPAVTYGVLADIPVPADYDGDGAADIAVFRPSSGTWFVKDKLVTVWGRQGDIPVPLDRNGDGRVEIGVFRRGTGVWYLKDAAGGSDTIAWGGPGDVPIGRGMFPWHSAFGKFDKDFDRDGRDDIVVFQPWTRTWRIHHSSGAPHEEVQWGTGTSSDLPVPGDYDGDGLTDLAVFEQKSGTWLIRGVAVIAWGQRGDVPVPADYDGDGITDIAVYRPSTGLWYIRGIGGLHYSQGLGTYPMPADVNGDGIADFAFSYFGSFSSQPWEIRSFTPLTPVQIGLRDIGCASPVAGDLDGDGDTDFGNYLCDTGTWHLADGREVAFGSPFVFGRGAWDFDVPLMLDRDGDGRAELGFFRPETGTWRFKNLVTGAIETVTWGQRFSSEIPLGARFESPVLLTP